MLLCLELGHLAAEPTPPCVTARPPKVTTPECQIGLEFKSSRVLDVCQ